jgi:hypothetical protein
MLTIERQLFYKSSVTLIWGQTNSNELVVPIDMIASKLLREIMSLKIEEGEEMMCNSRARYLYKRNSFERVSEFSYNSCERDIDEGLGGSLVYSACE